MCHPGLDCASSRTRLCIIQSLDSVLALHCQWSFHLVPLIYIFCQSTLFPLQINCITQCQHSMNIFLLTKTPIVGSHFYPSTLVLICYSTLGPFDGIVAAVIGDFICMMPNQTSIFLPLMQDSEVKLCADICYGLDNAMLWPQPWVGMYCHLGAISRKPDDPNHCLSIMRWDPTHDDFKLFGGSLVDGLGQLSGSRLSLLQTIISNMEDRIKQHKQWWGGPASIPRKPILFHF